MEEESCTTMIDTIELNSAGDEDDDDDEKNTKTKSITGKWQSQSPIKTERVVDTNGSSDGLNGVVGKRNNQYRSIVDETQSREEEEEEEEERGSEQQPIVPPPSTTTTRRLLPRDLWDRMRNTSNSNPETVRLQNALDADGTGVTSNVEKSNHKKYNTDGKDAISDDPNNAKDEYETAVRALQQSHNCRKQQQHERQHEQNEEEQPSPGISNENPEIIDHREEYQDEQRAVPQIPLSPPMPPPPILPPPPPPSSEEESDTKNNNKNTKNTSIPITGFGNNQKFLETNNDPSTTTSQTGVGLTNLFQSLRRRRLRARSQIDAGALTESELAELDRAVRSNEESYGSMPCAVLHTERMVTEESVVSEITMGTTTDYNHGGVVMAKFPSSAAVVGDSCNNGMNQTSLRERVGGVVGHVANAALAPITFLDRFVDPEDGDDGNGFYKRVTQINMDGDSSSDDEDDYNERNKKKNKDVVAVKGKGRLDNDNVKNRGSGSGDVSDNVPDLGIVGSGSIEGKNSSEAKSPSSLSKTATTTNVFRRGSNIAQLQSQVEELTQRVSKLESLLEDKEEEKKMWQQSALELQKQLNDLRSLSGILDEGEEAQKWTTGVL